MAERRGTGPHGTDTAGVDAAGTDPGGGPDPGAGPTDRELCDRARDGDPDAFGDLFDRHSRSVYNFLFRRTASWPVAEELTSAVFVVAWRRRRRAVLDRDSALPWLLGVAHRLAPDRDRDRGRDGGGGRGRDGESDLAARAHDERRMALAREAVDALPRHDREVVELCLWTGLDPPAAAVSLGLPVRTVRARLSRARRRLDAPDDGAGPGSPAGQGGPAGQGDTGDAGAADGAGRGGSGTRRVSRRRGRWRYAPPAA